MGIGTERGAIAKDVGTSLIGAGMVSVLVLPLLATAIAGRESSRRGDVAPDVARLAFAREVSDVE